MHPLQTLVLTLGIQYRVCNGDLYYYRAKDTCVSAEDCWKLQIFAYKVAKVCTDEYSPDKSSWPAPVYGTPYECSEGTYTVFSGGVARCVGDVAACAGLYVSEENKTCVDTPATCREYLRRHAYDAKGHRECVNCSTAGGFEYSVYCLTSEQCIAGSVWPYMINGTRSCRDIAPAADGGFDPVLLEAGVYACVNSLLDTTGDTSRCVDADDCKGLVAEPVPMCITEDQCYRSAWFPFTNVSREYCTSTWQCGWKGWHVYTVIRRCISAVPDIKGGGFIEWYDNI